MRLSTAKRVMLYSLVVWFGVLGCVLGCAAETYAAAAHTDHDDAPASQESDCSDACCKKGQGDPGPAPQPVTETGCCLYLSPSLVVPAQKAGAPAPAAVMVHDVADAHSDSACCLQRFSEQMVADSAGRHLRNSILRI